MKQNRMHPMQIIYSLFIALRNSSFIAFYLFILRFNDVSTFIKMARIAFIIFLVVWPIIIIINWWKTTYKLNDNSIHIYSGLFFKKDSSVPLEQVQNVHWHTPFFYQMFNLTSLSLETSTTNGGAPLKFKAIKKEEATRIERTLDDHKMSTFKQVDETLDLPELKRRGEKRTIHFKPSRKDLLKASFLSFSFLALIPILAIIYQKMDDVMNLDIKLKGILAFLTNSGLVMGAAITLFVLIAIGFGIARTFIKYGKYEIASSEERIYIQSGTLNESVFSIQKENIQAIKVIQTLLKKMMGLSEVKLVSAGSDDEKSEEINSLYPFLPNDRAYSLMEELLPDFKIEQSMNKLSRKALFIRMLRVPWLWIVATVLIFWLNTEWWYVSPILFALTYMFRIINYRNTRFLLNDEFIQFKTGGLWSTLFVMNRKKVIEIEVERTILQKKIGLATISTFNRTKPVHVRQLKDITFDTSHTFLTWYQDRHHDIGTEH